VSGQINADLPPVGLRQDHCMRLLSRFGVGSLLVAAALAPQPEAVGADLHPLDPSAPAGVVPTQNTLEGLVPLLDRESPAPSFAGEEGETSLEEETPAEAPPPADMPMNHGGMDHGAMGHGAPVAEAP
jgi:hypothetical protein